LNDSSLEVCFRNKAILLAVEGRKYRIACDTCGQVQNLKICKTRKIWPKLTFVQISQDICLFFTLLATLHSSLCTHFETKD